MSSSLNKSGLILSTSILGLNMISVFGLYSFLSFYSTANELSTFILLLSLIQVFSGGYGGNISQLIIREISKLKVMKKNNSSSVIYTCFFYALIISLLVAVMSYVLIINSLSAIYLIVIFVMIFFEFIIFINIAILRSLYSSSVPTIFLCLRYLFATLIIYSFTLVSELNLEKIIIGLCISSCFIGGLSTLIFYKKYRNYETFNNVNLVSNDFFSFYVSGSFNGLKVNLPIFFFGYFSFDSIPSYKIASQLALVLNSLRASFAIYFTPHYADSLARNDEELFLKSFKKNHFFVILLSSIIFITYYFFGEILINTFFDVNASTTIAFALILCLEAYIGILLPLDVFMNLKKLEKLVLYVNIFLFVSQITLITPAFYLFGELGVAWLYVLIAFVASIYCYFISFSKMKIIPFPLWQKNG